ncbi:DUF4124 domain-containing protein [sulfur-oxidizing endosymbiont of Gigantopelta aegis]|uniref:DUF4124 domain-containing protein n=1 Tax=sulfur-oxidizing endosymbiont of Gigantopelta aegis TaxID=2794934 RepID=UPI0018DEA823|nr:DUF4124 domain-containing protein [sulfur-oxidizing endosymbiont of Gigantopelta aegis]
MLNKQCLNKQCLNKQCLSFIVFFFFSASLSAQVYKCEDDFGNTNFSDQPCAKGETSERLDWLKGATSTKKQPKAVKKKRTTQAQKTAKKAKKNNQAYVLLSLLTTTQLELETATLRSSQDGDMSDSPELKLDDGITVDLLRVKKILLSRGKKRVSCRRVLLWLMVMKR